MKNHVEELLSAAPNHVVFDGWTEAAFLACVKDARLTEAEARAACPRGAIDLAAAYHRLLDTKLRNSYELAEGLRYSERVGALVRQRLKLADKEMVRRGMTLFSLPAHAAEGAQLIWETADTIWNILGDRSDDINWYSKRVILSGVIGSANLYWLGDTSSDDENTHAFVDRRIANVMQFEKLKANLRSNRSLAPIIEMQDRIFASVRAPSNQTKRNYPGWQEPGTR